MSGFVDKYAEVAGAVVVDQLYQLAKPLRGIKIVHVNSAASGGGVAEILQTMVPMMKSLGLDASWEVIKGDPKFFECTKLMHNALQGNRISIPSALLQGYEERNAQNAEELRPVLQEADVVIIHDPQPLPLIGYFPQRKGKWIWRCHIDASRPHRSVWKYLRPHIAKYDGSIFSLVDFAQPLPHRMFIVPPSIDPLSEKNIELFPDEVNAVLASFGIDPGHPMILQVSRFDRFKDPLGVIEAFRLASRFRKDLQLVLAGGGAADDPEGEAVLSEVRVAATGNPNIHILLLPSDAHRTINALQRGADVVLQKSIKEGFGLTVTEALWKGKPVIGGNTGGIRLQVIDHHTGFLVNTPEGAAHHIRQLLQDPDMKTTLGAKGREYVKANFLNTRHVANYLTMILSLFHDRSERLDLNALPALLPAMK